MSRNVRRRSALDRQVEPWSYAQSGGCSGCRRQRSRASRDPTARLPGPPPRRVRTDERVAADNENSPSASRVIVASERGWRSEPAAEIESSRGSQRVAVDSFTISTRPSTRVTAANGSGIPPRRGPRGFVDGEGTSGRIPDLSGIHEVLSTSEGPADDQHSAVREPGSGVTPASSGH